MVTLRLDDEADRNRYDIIESFEALDTQKTGCLDFDVAYTLLLGLGYMPDYKKKDEFNVTTLKEAAKRIESVQNENYNGVHYGSGIDLETLLAVVDTHPALSKGKQSESFASKCFKLLDRDNKGYATASDIKKLGNEVGLVDRNSKISTSEATEMISTATKIFGEGTKVHEDRLQRQVFQKLFEPSSH